MGVFLSSADGGRVDQNDGGGGFRPFEPAVEHVDYLTAEEVRRAYRWGGAPVAQRLIDEFGARLRSAQVTDQQQLEDIRQSGDHAHFEAAAEWYDELCDPLRELAEEPRQALADCIARGVRRRDLKAWGRMLERGRGRHIDDHDHRRRVRATLRTLARPRTDRPRERRPRGARPRAGASTSASAKDPPGESEGGEGDPEPPSARRSPHTDLLEGQLAGIDPRAAAVLDDPTADAALWRDIAERADEIIDRELAEGRG